MDKLAIPLDILRMAALMDELATDYQTIQLTCKKNYRLSVLWFKVQTCDRIYYRGNPRHHFKLF